MEDAQVVAMLVRRCIAGDAAAWEEIVQPYNRRIYNICYRFAGSGDDAQDLTQEVFIKMFRTLSSYDYTKGAFVTWVTTITRNLLVDHFRKTKQDRMTDSLDSTASDHEDAQPLSEQIPDQSAPPDAHVHSREISETGSRGLGQTFAGTPGICHSKGPTRYGLQGNRRRSEGSGGYREIPNKSRPRGTCAPSTTYL